MTAAIDHDEKSHATIAKKQDEHKPEEHLIDPNDVAHHEEAPKPAAKKIEKILEIMKDPKVEAKKAQSTSLTNSSAKVESNANKTNNSSQDLKLKADNKK